MHKILIVDDEDRYTERLPRNLRDFGLKDVEIDTSSTVQDALSKLAQNDYDLVSLDGMGQKNEWREIAVVAKTKNVDCLLTASVDWSKKEMPFFDKSNFSSTEGLRAFKDLIETRLNARGPQKEKI